MPLDGLIRRKLLYKTSDQEADGNYILKVGRMHLAGSRVKLVDPGLVRMMGDSEGCVPSGNWVQHRGELLCRSFPPQGLWDKRWGD